MDAARRGLGLAPLLTAAAMCLAPAGARGQTTTAPPPDPGALSVWAVMTRPGAAGVEGQSGGIGSPRAHIDLALGDVAHRATGRLDLLASPPSASLDGGVRTNGMLAVSNGGVAKAWGDPAAGGRFAWPIGKGWTFTAYGDEGGLGARWIGAQQLYALASHALSRHWSANVGWRRMRVDYADDPFVFDRSVNGPVVGAALRF
jgi:hypothetical protein